MVEDRGNIMMPNGASSDSVAETLKDRVEKLIAMSIGFIPNTAFRDMQEADLPEYDGTSPSVSDDLKSITSRGQSRMPAHLEQLCAAPLLSPQEERDLFCRLNFLRYRANLLRSDLTNKRRSLKRVVEIERLLAAAEKTRNRIIHANIRLVVSIVKRFADDRNRFDDLLSEGISCLINAVDKFDYARGFRFSTYATRAVGREVIRLVQRQHRDSQRYTTGSSELLSQESDRPLSPSGTYMTWQRLESCIGQLTEALDEREKFIVAARYGLDDIGEKPTFQRLGQMLGVSKERVRQIERRALEKLRKIADGLRLEPV